MDPKGRLDAERWERAVTLFEALVSLGPEQRERRLATEDPVLGLTVRRMLERDETGSTLLDEGLGAVAEIALEDRPRAPELEVGDHVGDFEILGLLGRGGMGVVYEARDPHLGRRAAVKLLPRARTHREAASRRLFAEARAASALDHPNIATVYQVGEAGTGPYIAMARYEGETLRDRLLRGPLPPREAVDVAIQVARALSVAHAAGIVHRDVKPGNIFLTKSGLVKLLDFGIAATGESGPEANGHGTPGYMSPEQAKQEPPDARSDVWSLGVVIHEMMTGEAMGRKAASLPGWIRGVVARCLSVDAARRYRDGTRLLEALERCGPPSRADRVRGMAILALVAAGGLALRGILSDSSSARVPVIAVGVVEDIDAPAEAAGIDLAGPSVLANRLYEEGLRAFYDGDLGSAKRFFASALEEDSDFAMAAFYEWRSHWVDRVGRVGASDSLLQAALERARDLPERERLLVQAHYAWTMWEPSALAVAESLATRHPEVPDGHLILGRSAVRAGEPRRAVLHLHRLIEMDSLSLRGTTALCYACEAFPVLADAYQQIDSIDAAEQTLREWLRWRPRSSEAWSALAYFLEEVGREDEALAARREEAKLDPGRTMSAIYPARAALRAGRWAAADQLLAERIRHGSPFVEGEGLWLLAISLREQGRLEEAIETERIRLERSWEPLETPAGSSTHFEGQLLTELGRPDEAARVFTFLVGDGRSSKGPGAVARRIVWPMAHLATAEAAAGDTVALAVAIDSLVAIGPRSALVSDRRLHHYARGLLFSARGDLRGAERELRLSIGPDRPFTRAHLELGRTLLALGRPLEAIEVLEPALRGGLEGSRLYASRTELHEALGHAWEAAGRPELALPHYHWVAEAWNDPDPMFRPRRDSVLLRIAALTASH